MEHTTKYNILETREDGTFVIELDGKPFHVTYEYSPEIFIALGGVVEREEALRAEVQVALDAENPNQ